MSSAKRRWDIWVAKLFPTVCYQARKMWSSFDSTGFHYNSLLTKTACDFVFGIGLIFSNRGTVQPWMGRLCIASLRRSPWKSGGWLQQAPEQAVNGEAGSECLPPVGKQMRHRVCAVQALLPNPNRMRVSVIPNRGYVMLGNKILLSGLPFIL